MKKLLSSFALVSSLGLLSTQAFSDCFSVFNGSDLNIEYGSKGSTLSNGAQYVSVSFHDKCGVEYCLDGTFPVQGYTLRIEDLKYSGNSWYMNWFDGNGSPMWARGSCSGGIAQGDGAYNDGHRAYWIKFRSYQ